MNSNGNYYDNSYYAQNCSLPLPLAASEFVPFEYSGGTNSFGSSMTSSNHQPSFTIQYAYETAGVPTEMAYGYQFAPTATEPLQMHQQQQYLPQNQQYQQIVWTQPQFLPATFDPNLHNENPAVNSIELNKLAEGVASIKFGQKKAVKRKYVPVATRRVKGRGYASAGTNKRNERKRTDDQIIAQAETKKKNEMIIKLPKFQAMVEKIMLSIGRESLNGIKDNFMKCSKYKQTRRIDPYKYFRGRIEQILLKTTENDREKLVKLFELANYWDHIWAVAKNNAGADEDKNKKFTMQINVFKKPYQLAEILIIMKRGILMEPGELSRFKIIGNCKMHKQNEGRQCLNPWHYEHHYSVLDGFLFNKRLQWQQSQIKGKFVGGKIGDEWEWDAQKEEKANFLNSFGGVNPNEDEECSQNCSSNCSSP